MCHQQETIADVIYCKWRERVKLFNLIFEVSHEKKALATKMTSKCQDNIVHLNMFRSFVKSAYQEIKNLVSQPKHMLWVLKRTVSVRRFF